MKRILCILLLLACVANAETWIYGRSRLSTGYRQEKNNGKIPFSLYPPALWYEMNYNDSTVVYDLSGNNNTGTVSGATWVADKTGGYYSFDATGDIVTVTHNATLSAASSYSVSLWVNFIGGISAQPKAVQVLYSKRIAANSDGTFFVGIKASRQIWFGFYDTAGSARYVQSGTLTNEVDTWGHVVGVFDDTANTIKIYWNGILNNTAASITQTPKTNTRNVIIGNMPELDSGLNGSIDAVLYYPTTALTSNQIISIYNRGR